MPELTFEKLKAAVSGSAAAFRCRNTLQPAGGEGDKVFPPTYAGAVYAVEKRKIPQRNEPVPCVLLDSVQSQANRMEEALQKAVDSKELSIPLIQVDFSDYAPTGNEEEDRENGKFRDDIGKITSLQVPHRLADAILRDSEVEENDEEQKRVGFRKSKIGKDIDTASLKNATPIFRLCPTALLFGMWDSAGIKGGLGAKFERAMVSEVVGIGAKVGDLLRGVRRDPLEIRAEAKVIKKVGDWRIAKEDQKGAIEKGAVSPSAINHSSVPFPKQREKKTDDNNYSGATIEYAEQLTTLSLIALRRLSFPVNGAAFPEANQAGRAVLAALGLCAATLAFESGMGLRSRCLLWPVKAIEWELLDKPGQEPQRFSLDRSSALRLVQDAYADSKAAGLGWMEEPLTLKPSEKLVDLVRKSQELAVGEEAGA